MVSASSAADRRASIRGSTLSWKALALAVMSDRVWAVRSAAARWSMASVILSASLDSRSRMADSVRVLRLSLTARLAVMVRARSPI